MASEAAMPGAAGLGDAGCAAKSAGAPAEDAGKRRQSAEGIFNSGTLGPRARGGDRKPGREPVRTAGRVVAKATTSGCSGGNGGPGGSGGGVVQPRQVDGDRLDDPRTSAGAGGAGGRRRRQQRASRGSGGSGATGGERRQRRRDLQPGQAVGDRLDDPRDRGGGGRTRRPGWCLCVSSRGCRMPAAGAGVGGRGGSSPPGRTLSVNNSTLVGNLAGAGGSGGGVQTGSGGAGGNGGAVAATTTAAVVCASATVADNAIGAGRRRRRRGSSPGSPGATGLGGGLFVGILDAPQTTCECRTRSSRRASARGAAGSAAVRQSRMVATT